MARVNLFLNLHASESWWVEGSCMHAKSLQSCLTLCNPMDCTQPGYSVHGIPQTRILERVATPFSRGSSPPRDGTCISFVSCIDRWIFYHTKGRFGFNRTWGKTWNSTLLKGSKRADIADQWTTRGSKEPSENIGASAGLGLCRSFLQQEGKANPEGHTALRGVRIKKNKEEVQGHFICLEEKLQNRKGLFCEIACFMVLTLSPGRASVEQLSSHKLQQTHMRNQATRASHHRSGLHPPLQKPCEELLCFSFMQ